VAGLLASMTAGELLVALGPTSQIGALIAEDVGLKFLTTVAKAIYKFNTGRTGTVMTGLTAHVATRQLFLTRSTAGRSWFSTLDGRVKLDFMAGAPEGLIRDMSAGFAVT